MKKFLLIGTALLSISAYVSDMNSAYGSTSPTPSKEMMPEKTDFAEQWKAIVSDLSNKDIAVYDFKESINKFKQDYRAHNSSPKYPYRLPLELDFNNLNATLIKALQSVSADSSKENIIGIWDIIRKLDLLFYNDGYSLIVNGINKTTWFKNKEITREDAIKNAKALIEFVEHINQPGGEKLFYERCDNDELYSHLQHTSEFFMKQKCEQQTSNLLDVGDITALSLYSPKDGFTPSAIAILWPQAAHSDNMFLSTYNQILCNPAIFCDFIKGSINYATDIAKDPEMLQAIEAVIYNNFNQQGSNIVFNKQEPVIDLIQKKQQDTNLSSEFIERLEDIEASIFNTIPYLLNWQQEFNRIPHLLNWQQEIDNDSDPNTDLENFKTLVRNMKSHNVKIATDHVLNWIICFSRCDFSNPATYQQEISHLRLYQSDASNSILTLKQERQAPEAQKDDWNQKLAPYIRKNERHQKDLTKYFTDVASKIIKKGRPFPEATGYMIQTINNLRAAGGSPLDEKFILNVIDQFIESGKTPIVIINFLNSIDQIINEKNALPNIEKGEALSYLLSAQAEIFNIKNIKIPLPHALMRRTKFQNVEEALDFWQDENTRLVKRISEYQEKIESHQKEIDELNKLITREQESISYLEQQIQQLAKIKNLYDTFAKYKGELETLTES